ncbi:MAG: TadE/TadG family type IV pilus assembly protein [Candidatus Dormiibacterota bacterium]
MVELALTFPLLLLLGASVADYGYYIEHLNNISTVVRDSARYASENTLNAPWTSACPNPTWSSGTGAYSCPSATDPSATIEGVLQLEAESLTVPEGGLPLDNVDCIWSGGTPSSISGLTGTAPSTGGTASLPSSFPEGLSGTPVSCITVAYYTSSDGSYSTASLSLYGWWSSDQSYSGGYGCFEYVSAGAASCTSTSSQYPVAGDLVRVTVIYGWSQSSPGPVFTVLNSTFHINANIASTYSFVVSS